MLDNPHAPVKTWPDLANRVTRMKVNMPRRDSRIVAA